MAFLKLISALIFVLYLLQIAESASILALFSSLSFSDHVVFRGYISRLVQHGHSVVMMTPYPGRFIYPDTERIVELDVGQESAEYWDEFKKLITNTDDYHTRLRAIDELAVKLAIAQLKSKQMTALFINPNIKFDLVITEADVPLLYAVADKYKAPHIALTTSTGKIHQYQAKGTVTHPILYPDVNTLNYRNSTSWEKFVEFKRHLQTKFEYSLNYLGLCDVAAKKILGLKRDLSEVETDIDLLLVAANPLLIGSRPSVPSIVYVDRLHIKPGLNLAQDLKAVLDSASKGAIYFSIGAIQESEELAPVLLQTFADAFKELPFTVLWKMGNTSVIKLPENVLAQAWFPQQEVLAHPNLKVFITHGGPRSLDEALFYEVPIVGLPIVKSRKVFIGELTRHGAGEILDPYYLQKNLLKETILRVATINKYKESITQLRAKVVDPVISGPENAIWWTNYIIRHKGGRHLRSAAVNISFTEYYLLDIFTVVILGFGLLLSLSLLISFYTYRFIRRRFLGRDVDLGGKFKAL